MCRRILAAIFLAAALFGAGAAVTASAASADTAPGYYYHG